MSALGKRAAEVEQELGATWTRYHVGAQAARFLSGVLVTLVLSLHNGFTDWTSVLPLLGGAAWATAAQMWPQVPWSLLKRPDTVRTPVLDPTPPVDPAPPKV